jgi:peptidoglycan/LPS O-acetylase OafA/YrhL
MSRIISLDYLRGIAALSVALPHFFVYHSISGQTFEAISAVAVEVFFVLSGYVLAEQVLYVVGRRQAAPLGIFLARRWMRTIPPYVVALCAMSWLTSNLGTADFYRYLFYMQNFAGQNNQSDYFAVAWSLSVEEWFYVGFPLFLLAVGVVSKTAKPSSILTAAAIFILGMTVLRSATGDLGDWGASVRRVVVYRIDSIACGFVLHLAVRDYLSGRPRSLPLAAAMIAAGLLSVWITLLAEHGNDVAKELFPLVTVAFGSFAVLFAMSLDRVIERNAVVARIGVTLGRLSYSLYLFHTVFLTVIGSTAQAGQALLVQLLIYCVICGSFSAAFYLSFEAPILKLRPKYRDHAAAAAALPVRAVDAG